ncbi:MAG: calcium-binding protein, partial [Betaproteobacteria bacterium]|nr:calcium-binding protein [Betaproteobacteria bacterium]
MDVINSGVFAVDGGQGDDVLTGGGQGRLDEPRLRYEFFMGNGGNDLIDGRGGWDIASYVNDTGAISVDMSNWGSQVTDGGGDRDTLISVEQVDGSAFADTMKGTSNTTGLEASTLAFMGLEGNDTIDGNGGVVYALYNRDKAAVTVNLSTGTATDGWGGTDTLRNITGVVGSAFGDTLTGNASSNVFEGRGGNDTITGGGGDFVAYRDSQAAVNVNLAAGSAQDGWGGTDTLVNINGVYGSVFADTLTGGSGNDTLVGGAGNDTLTGGGGVDVAGFSGPMSRYTWTAGTSAGTVIVTDSQSSTPSFDSSTGNWSVGDGTDMLVNISKLVFSDSVLLLGTSGADSMTGSSGADALDGLSGADTLVGGLGNDTYYVDNSSDLVTEAAGAGIDTVIASVGYSLPDNVENLTLRVTGNWGSYTGNALDNTVVVANGVNASINAGSGNDTLVRSGNYSDYWMGLNPDGSVSMWDHTAGISVSGFEKLVFADRTIAVPQIGIGVDLNGVFNPDTSNHDRIGPNAWWRNSDGSNGTNLTTFVARNAELNLGGLINQMRISLPKPTGSGLNFTLGDDSTQLTLVAPGTGGTAVLDSTWRDVPGMGNVEAQISQRAGSSTYDLMVRQKAGIDASDADFMNALRSLQVGMLNTADATVQDIPITVEISSNGGSTWLGASAGQLGTTTLRLDGTANAPAWSSFSKREIAIGFGEALAGGYNDEWSQRNAGTPSTDLFKVTVNGNAAQVLEVKIEAGLQLTLDRGLSTTDVVVVSYASPAGDQRLNVLQDRSGNDVASFQLTVSPETSSTSTGLTGITGTIYYPGGLNVNTDLVERSVDQLSGGGEPASFMVTSVQPNGSFTASLLGSWRPNTMLDPVTSPGFQPGMVTRSKLDISGTGAPSTWKAGTTFTGDAIWSALQSSGASLTTWEDWVQGSQDGSTVSFSQQLDAVTVASGSQVSIPRLVDGVMGYLMNFAGVVTVRDMRHLPGQFTNSPDSIDTLTNVENLQFSDRTITTAGLPQATNVNVLAGTTGSGDYFNPTFSSVNYVDGGWDNAPPLHPLANDVDTLDYSSYTAGVAINTADGTVKSTASPGVDRFRGIERFTGTAFDDTLVGGNPDVWYEVFIPGAGNDTINAGVAPSRMSQRTFGVDYSNAGSGITNAVSGITLTYTSDKQATITSSTDGTDTLTLANFIVGSAYADTINVSQYGGAKPFLGGGLNGYGTIRVNMGGGNDTLTGNGYTRIDYANGNAPDGVGLVVNLTAGTVDATRLNGGVDTFSGVSGVFGSSANDTLLGGTTHADTLRYREFFVGNAGDDSINGGSGLDIAGASGYYWLDTSTNLAVGKGVGVDVNLSAGTMSNAADTNANGSYTVRFGSFNGTDTLRSVEGVFGTQYSDTYTA